MTTFTRWRRPRIRPAWIFAAIVAVLLSAMLVIAGFANSQVSNDAKAHSPVGTDRVPESVRDGGAVVNALHAPVTSTNPAPGTIALTFDDGPDPTWTPQVLSILRKYHVPATFFVVGSLAARHPELLRAIVASGSEIGLHTFTHPDLVDVSPWRLSRELDETESVVTGATGMSTDLFRPPYSSTADAIDNLEYQVVTAAAARGYVSVFTDTDSDDWARPGVGKIISNATPAAGQGAIVLMHDAGGDRSETVAALDRLIPRLQREGYRFTTVTDAVGLAPANQPASSTDRLSGRILLDTIGVSLAVVDGVQWVLLVVGVLVVLRLLLMLFFAGRHARRRHDPAWRWGPPVTEPVSVIVPAYNESSNIEVALRSIMASDHPIEVVVVDDGSTDGTADLVESLGLPGVRVIRQPNGGKPAALNTGIAHARYDLIVMVDGDTMFEPDTVRQLVQPFADRKVGAVSGNVKIANRGTFLTRLQHIEYVFGFNVDRRVHDLTGSICTVPGAAGAFRRSALLEVGGVSAETLAEDTDLTIAIGRAGWRTVYQERAVAWTEAPTTVRQLWLQRYRWTFGTMQSVWKHRHAIGQRGASGRMGRLGLLHVIAFQIVLPITAPLIDLFFVYGLLFLDAGTTLVLWLAIMLLQTFGALFAFHLDGEDKGALWLIPMQQVVYRQLMYVVLAQSVLAALSGIRVRWQQVGRLGALQSRLIEAPAERPPAPLPPVPAADTTDTAGSPIAVRARAVPVDPVAEAPAAPEPPAVPEPPAPAPAARPRREQWLDSLRALALVRVVLYHVTGWGWLSIVFPSMGVMFALGGSLMVSSLRRTPSVDVVGHRIRRLVPPLWLLGAIAIPLMLAQGWTHDTGDTRFSAPQLIFWVLPILDPPGSAWGADVTVVLWYIRAYLWFVLLTPVLLAAFRRRPVLCLLTPIAVVFADALLGSPLADSGPIGQGVLDFCTFGACWMLGFAHREGMLRRLRPTVLIGLFLAGFGLGGWWTVTHPLPDGSWDLNGIPPGQALISAAAVLVLLRFSPGLAWMDRVPGLGRLVRVLNARAVTIYLWHNIAVDLCFPITGWMRWSGLPAQLVVTGALVTVAVLAFGWVEDLAARRPVRLIPGRRAKAVVVAPPHPEPVPSNG